MPPIFCDILIAAIVVLAALRGRHRGFVLTLCGFLTIFVAFIGASIVSELLTPPVAALLEPLVEQAVLAVLAQATSANTAELSMSAVLSALQDAPFFAGLAETFRSALESGMAELTEDAVVAVAQFAALKLSRILLFLLSFTAIIVAWWILSHALDLAFHLPGLNFLNRTGGLALGFGQGIAVCFILCWLLKDSYLTAEMMENSFFLPYFAKNNPLMNFSL
jgi:uncharacterized membrane protein required for colicin V production